MRIAICDSDRACRKNLHGIIAEYKKNIKLQVDISEFENGYDLILSSRIFDLVLLGYRFLNEDGMDTARKLRSENPLCEIVFVTEYPEFIFDAFQVHPYDFLKKPVEKARVCAVLDSFFESYRRIYPISVLENGELITILADDIVYLEGDGKACIVRTKKRTFHSSKTLSEVFDTLPKHCFYRIHRSYVVNMNYISTIESKIVTFSNGEKALISKDRFADFMKKYYEFCAYYGIKV